MANPFVRASRKNVPIKLAFRGPSGSGKTMSALKFARGLVGQDGKIALIDTENSSASMYENVTEFDTVTLSTVDASGKKIANPFHPNRYIQLIHAAEEAGYDCLIIDSISHAWAKEGGVLDLKDKLDAGQKMGDYKGRSGDSFGNWRHANKFQEPLIDAILHSPMHIICTMRTKTDWVIEAVQTDNGIKNVPKKLGLAPVQREDVEYEFTIVFDVDGKTHVSTTSKDRSGLLNDFGEIVSEGTGIVIRQWLEGGALEPEQRPAAETPSQTAIATGSAVPAEPKPTPKPEPKPAPKPAPKAAEAPKTAPKPAAEPKPKAEDNTIRPEMAYPIVKRENSPDGAKWDAITTPTHYLYLFHEKGVLLGEEGQVIQAVVQVKKTEKTCFDGRKRPVAEILSHVVLDDGYDDLDGPIADGEQNNIKE